MAPRGRPRRARQVVIDVPATGSANRLQRLDEMSSNPPNPMEKRITNPADVDEWLSLIVMCFEVIECSEEKKVKLATFLLQSSAKDWWTFHAARVGGTKYVMWEEFRKALRDKFYPCSFCDEKRKKFMSLLQGDMTVIEYEKIFTELAKYTLDFVIDEVDKCKQFGEGLRIEIRAPITASINWSDFSKLVDVAM
ncbi:uncharacterized protein E6C27_scaffold34G002910 [Cucumis melo var. makuwa]|uniref:Retrotransposon gag domain-containing protein n=1 Tax=Cucumis melo var. makuwa TaxID=1194695 RepID=A0A5A7SND8_CUCMM|nr:uncharacterized protein E6C27_scaffold34G002910 [Cucumis melo var. makuwa]